MATAEDSQPEMYLNFYNAGQSKLLYVTDSISPSPSAQSENSIECSKEPQHDDQDSSTGTCDDDEHDNEDDDDDSTQELTNLTWLTQLKNLVEWPNSVNPILDDDALDSHSAGKSTNVPGSVPSLTKKDTLNDRFQRFVGQAKQNWENYNKSAELYQMDTTDKPPFNYAQMIAMAMLENGRMTLQHIYSWIQSKFGYYRVRNNWNNSIRHNLSLQFCFRKIDRNVYNKGDGKGGYWELGIDANKSERKRIRNRSRVRTSISSPKSSESPTIAEKRRKCCNDRPHITSINSKHLTNQDVNLIIDDFAGSQNNNYLFNRTLNSINASISVDHTLHVDDIGIGSIIEVDQQIAQVVAAQNTHDIANQEQNHHQINLSQASNEFHVLGDITNGDYLNINTLDLMSSADDMFDSDSFAPASASDGLSTVSAKDSGVPELITTMVTSMAMDSQCGNEIYLASEVPQPSANVVISALNPYGDEGAAFRNNQTVTNVVIEDVGTTYTGCSPVQNKNDHEGNDDETNLIKSFDFAGIDEEFELLPSCSTPQHVNRDDFIEVLYDISTHHQDY